MKITGIIRISTTQIMWKNKDTKIWISQTWCYICISDLFIFQADYEQHYIISNPTSCSNPENCQGANICPVKTAGSFNYKDYQEIKIQVCYICFSSFWLLMIHDSEWLLCCAGHVQYHYDRIMDFDE